MDRLRQLIHEIHRRSLWQVLAIYAVASWAVISGVGTLGDALGLPDWFPRLALGLLVVGLPIVLATAFVQEGVGRPETQRAKVRTKPAPAASLFTWRNAFGGGVLAFALWGVVAAGWVLFGGAARDPAGNGSGIEPSIAVMPCDDLSPTENQASLAQGLAEEVSLALSGLEGVEKVSGRSSTVTLKSQGADLPTIASTLGVANVLNCAVARSGDQVRVTAELTEAATGAVLWSDRFQEQFTDLFAVYDVIARGVADGLRLALAGNTGVPLVAEATESAVAHEAYLRGRYLLEQRTPESLQNAATQFQRATELDPQYAEAYAGLADTYVLQASFGWLPEPDRFRALTREGLAASQRATELDPDLGIAFPGRGFGLWNLGEWEAADEAFETAIRLNPQYALAHQWYGLLLFTTGRVEEGVREAERAVELDPLYRQGYRNLAWGLAAAGRIDDAISVYEEIIELAPDWFLGWQGYGYSLLRQSNPEEGVAAILEAARLGGYDVDGYEEAARATLNYALTGEPQRVQVPADLITDEKSNLYFFTGQAERALEVIETNINLGRIGVMALGHSSLWFGPIRSDPRYQAVLQQAGIIW